MAVYPYPLTTKIGDYINDLINSWSIGGYVFFGRRRTTILSGNVLVILCSITWFHKPTALRFLSPWSMVLRAILFKIFHSWASFNNSAGFKFSLNLEFDITHLETFLGLMINSLYYSLFPSPASVVKIYLHCRDLARPLSLSEFNSATQSIPYDEYTLIISFLFKLPNYIIPA